MRSLLDRSGTVWFGVLVSSGVISETGGAVATECRKYGARVITNAHLSHPSEAEDLVLRRIGRRHSCILLS